MAKDKFYKPGQEAPVSGQYGVRGLKGADLGREVTVTRGEPLPPTQKPGQKYILNDRTKH
jgi:hypothetical protein